MGINAWRSLQFPKYLEELLLVFRFNPEACVFYRENEIFSQFFLFDLDPNIAFGCEFESVREEVQDNLRETALVHENMLRNILPNVKQKVYVLSLTLKFKDVLDVE